MPYLKNLRLEQEFCDGSFYPHLRKDAHVTLCANDVSQSPTESESDLSLSNETALFQQTVTFSIEQPAHSFEAAVQVQKTYELKKEIARGGMGRIFLAQDEKLHRQVAVKVSTSCNSGESSAFYREAKILAHLSHPNIVPVHNFGHDSQGRPFYSMKLVRGRTLQDILKQLHSGDAEITLNFTPQRLLAVFRKVCNAIEFAHASGYLHRDLKPGNVMIGEYGEVLVMDWGLAQPLRLPGQAEVKPIGQEGGSRCVEGTPRYMSPEQAALQPLDERSDIYFLGAILYAILALRAPIQGRTIEEILEKVKRGELSPLAAPPSKIRQPGLGINKKEVPKALEAVLKKAMHLDPSLRYQKVSELNWDIEAYQNGFATSAEDAGALRQLSLLIRRHRLLTAVLVFSFLGAMTSTVRLSRSERHARLYAERAEENARRAEQNAISAHNQELAAKEAHRASQMSAAREMLSAAQIAEKELDPKSMKQALMNVKPEFRSQKWNDLNSKLNTADLTIEAPNQLTFKAVVDHPSEKTGIIALLSDGSIRGINLISGEITLLGVVETQGVLASWVISPTLAISHDATRVAVVRNLKTMSEEANCQLEILDLSSGAILTMTPLKLSPNFLKKVHLTFDPSDQALILSSQREAGVFMIDVENGGIKWRHESVGGTFTSFGSDWFQDKPAIFVYTSKDVVELELETGALIRKLYEGEIPYFSTTRKLIPQIDQGGFLTTNASGWIRFDPKKQPVAEVTPVRLGAVDIVHFSNLNTVVTVSPQSGGYGVLQFWDAGHGDAFRSEMLHMEHLSARDCTLHAREEACRVMLMTGLQIKVWQLASPENTDPIHDQGDVLKERDSDPGFSNGLGLLLEPIGEKKKKAR